MSHFGDICPLNLSIPSLERDAFKHLQGIKNKTTAETVEYVKLAARHDFFVFCRYVLGDKFKAYPIHRRICDELTAVGQGRHRKQIISTPPRAGKSLLTSQAFPAWILGRNPTCANMISSYNTALTRESAMRTLEIMNSPRYQAVFPSLVLKSDKAVDIIRTSMGGMSRITPASSNCTGFTFGALEYDVPPGIALMDDVLATGNSQSILENTWQWTAEQFLTRKLRNNCIISMGTRFHKEDITGKLIATEGLYDETNPSGWHSLIIPAFCVDEDTDPLNRKVGESHWPEYFPVEQLEVTRKQIGEKIWQTLYQCNPLSDENTIFTKLMIQYMTDIPEISKYRYRYLAIDTAFSTKESADESVIVTCGVTLGAGGKQVLHIIESIGGQWDFHTLLQNIIFAMRKWKCNIAVVENRASGQSIIQELQRVNIPTHAVNVRSDKVTRAHAVTPPMIEGRVFFNNLSPSHSRLEEQLLSFPLGSYDDRADATIHAIQYFQDNFANRTGGSVFLGNRNRPNY